MHDGTADLAECKALYAVSGLDEEEWGDHFTIREDGREVRYPAYTIDTLLSLLPAHTLEKLPNGSYAATWRGQISSHADFTKILHMDARATVVLGGTSEIHTDSRTSAGNALCRLATALYHAGVLLADGEPYPQHT